MEDRKLINKAIVPQGKSVGEFVEVDGVKMSQAEYDNLIKKQKAKEHSESKKGSSK